MEMKENKDSQLISALQTTVVEMEKKENKNSQLLSTLQSTVEEQQKLISEQNSTINTLQANMAERTHIESGFVKFGASNSWSPQQTTNNVVESFSSITFRRPFPSPPQVVASMERLYTPVDKRLYIEVQVTSVSKTGFKLRTSTDHTYLSHISYLHVYWMAVPPYQ